MGHHLKWFPLDNNQWCFIKERLAQILCFRKKLHFLAQIVFISDFLVQIRNPKISAKLDKG